MRTLLLLVLTLPAPGAWEGMPARDAAYQQFFDERRVIAPIDLVTDPTGNLWIATRDALLRFDGSQYLKVESPLPAIRRMCKAGDGSLWLGGPKGLLRYEKGLFRIVSDEAVAGLACTDSSTVYTANPKLRRWDPTGRFQDFDGEANQELVAAWDNTIWFGCGTDVCRLKGDRVERITVSAGERWKGAVQSHDSRIYATFNKRMYEIEGFAANHKARILPELVTALAERQFATIAGRKEIWTEARGGIATLGGQSQPWSIPVGGSFATVIYPDSSHTLWIGTLASGIFRVDLRQPLRRWSRDHALQGEIRAVLPEGPNSVIGTSLGVWRSLDNGSFQHLFPHDVFNFVANPDGTFWAVSHGEGLVRFDRNGRLLARVRDPDPDQIMMNDLRDIHRDETGQVWVAGKTGLYRLVESPEPKLIPQPPLERAYISEIQEDHAHTLWLTGEGTLWRKSTTGFSAHPFDPPLPTPRYRTLAIRSPEDLWLGYRVGLGFTHIYRRDGKWSADHFDDASVPGTRDTHFLRVDRRGWVWRGTREGVFVTPSTHPQLEDWLLLSGVNGLRGGAASMRGFHEGNDGSVWIATYDAVTRLEPRLAWFDEKLWRCWISSVSWNDQRHLDPAAFPVLLPAGPRRLRVQVGRQTPYPGPPVRLQYRLFGQHEDWRTSRNFELETEVGGNGRHVLEVRLSFAGKTSAAVQYPFQIAAPWYRSTMFLGTSSTLAGASLLLYWLRPAWLVLLVARMHYRARVAGSALRIFESSQTAGFRDLSGELLQGRYAVRYRVAQGGFSAVYLAKDKQSGDRPVAIKAIRIQAEIKDWQYRHFGQEVAALNSVRHPSVIRIEDSWIDTDGQPMLVMPFVDGPSLRTWLGESHSAAEKHDVLGKIAAGVGEMHRRGVVHCDLKPENILLSRNGDLWQPVIIDFGVSGLRQQLQQMVHFTRAVGTPPYMAPEQVLGNFGVPTDVYAFAVVTLELLFGIPFERAALTWDWTTLPRLGAWLPAPVAAHFHHALRQDPSRRCTNVEEWLEGLIPLVDS